MQTLNLWGIEDEKAPGFFVLFIYGRNFLKIFSIQGV